jgi:hypothetical protein
VPVIFRHAISIVRPHLEFVHGFGIKTVCGFGIGQPLRRGDGAARSGQYSDGFSVCENVRIGFGTLSHGLSHSRDKG